MAVVTWCVPVAEAAAPSARLATGKEPSITPIPKPRTEGDRRVALRTALGERLFKDARLSANDSRSCNSCHDLATNGGSGNVTDLALDGSPLALNTPTVFNAALNFRLNWEGNLRSLEDQVAASLRNPLIMGGSLEQALARLSADPQMVRQFQAAYGRGPEERTLLDAISTFERSLLTTESRFDRWLRGERAVLSARELSGYAQFKLHGCISCHQGVNVGGNLFQRQGIFRPLVLTGPRVVRVPSLRNVAETAPYFHDGSAPTLESAVRRMAAAQLNTTLTQTQVEHIVAFLETLTGNHQGRPLGARR